MLALEPTEKETWEQESEHDKPANSADKSSASLDRVSDVSKGEESRQNVDDSMDQETSQSLISLSQTQDPGVSIAESSQSIIPRPQEHRLRPTEENPGIGDTVEVHLRQTKRGRKGRPVTRCGRVTEIKPNEPNRVKTDTCLRKFRKVWKIITRHSTFYDFK
eukprot:g14491.t1